MGRNRCWPWVVRSSRLGREPAKRLPIASSSGKEVAGLLGSKAIKWNFTKFLVGKDGQVIKRYAPLDKPADMAKDIEAALTA